MNSSILRTTINNMNTKINFMSNEIENDLFNLKKTYSTNFHNFNPQSPIPNPQNKFNNFYF